jgi:predicted dehydrogenase
VFSFLSVLNLEIYHIITISMAPLRVSILGTGLSLQAFHYPLITGLPEQYVLHSILERSNSGKAKAVAGDSVKVVTTIEEVVNDKDVDVVSVTWRSC